jgi:patatin-like phospholipase/acyl hydrolase
MRVLSIDGGGIRGIIPALVLCHLEERTGRPVGGLFDLVAGTSTGGIIAAALTRPDPLPASEILDLYRTEGPRIFRRSLGRRITSAEGVLDEKHDDEVLNAVLARYLGSGRLSDASTRVLVTAYDLQGRRPWLFKSWRPDRDGTLTDVVRATSAAPTYFEPWPVGDLVLVDGGVYAMNPGMCAYAEARRLEDDAPSLVLSLGTGQVTRPITFAQSKDWGLLEWARPVIDVVLDGVADTVDYQLRELMPPGTYIRLQTTLDRASDALDDAGPRNLALLQEQARELVAANADELDRVAELLLAPRG